ncbi:hypothetical protein [Streptococcus suis]
MDEKIWSELAYTKSVKKTRTGETKMEHKYSKEERKFDFKTVAILILVVLGIIYTPGILLGLFEVGKEVGHTLATLLK